MSLEKLAHDSYTQGFTDTLRNLNVSDSVKVAAYKQAASAGVIAGALGQHEARKRMETEKKAEIDPGTAALVAAGLAGTAYGAHKLDKHMDDVAETNRLYQALGLGGLGASAGFDWSPARASKLIKGRNALIGAGAVGLGSYLLDDKGKLLRAFNDFVS